MINCKLITQIKTNIEKRSTSSSCSAFKIVHHIFFSFQLAWSCISVNFFQLQNKVRFNWIWKTMNVLSIINTACLRMVITIAFGYLMKSFRFGNVIQKWMWANATGPWSKYRYWTTWFLTRFWNQQSHMMTFIWRKV